GGEPTGILRTGAGRTTGAMDQKGVELTGAASAASALIPVLENSPRLERVEFSSPVTRGRDTREQFRIRASWEAAGATAPPPATPTGLPAAGPSPSTPVAPRGAVGAPTGAAPTGPAPTAEQPRRQPVPG